MHINDLHKNDWNERLKKFVKAKSMPESQGNEK